MKKKLLYTLLLTATVFTAPSCSDFLTEENHTDIEKGKFFNNAKEAELVLQGAYQKTTQDAMYGYHLSFYFDMGTDCAQTEGQSIEGYRVMPTNSFTATQKEIRDTWFQLYKGIYATNDFLERISSKIDSYSSEDQSLGTIYMAEARALRALYYFELVHRFKNVPLITTTAMSYQDPNTMEQAAPDDVFRFIEEDLKYAIEVLPYAKEDKYRKDNSFRFSKGAAMGLLTKVYATWSGEPFNANKWEDAVKVSGALINSGQHNLLENFEDLWKNTCNGVWDPTESLIEISFYSPTYTGGSDPCGRIGKWNGVKTAAISGERARGGNSYRIPHTFVLKWRAEDGVDQDNPKGTNPNGELDLRRDISIANYIYESPKKGNPTGFRYIAKGGSDTDETAIKNDLDPSKRQKEKQGYTPAKWDIVKYGLPSNYLMNNDRSNVNWYVLRYADVLLLYAEALNEWKQGPTTEAYEAINKVRRRAYGNNTTKCDLPAGLDYEAFKQAVRDERGYELAFEGHRRSDLVRWGIYYETVQETYKNMKDWYSDANYTVYFHTKKNKHEFLPIPQREMDLCAKFNQNTGW